MKFVICRNCGNAMNGIGGITACTKCSQSDLQYHYLYYDTDSFDLTKRLDAISAPYKKKHPSPAWGLLTVILVAASTAGWQEITLRPGGEFAQQAVAIAASTPILPSDTAASKTDTQKSINL